MNRQPFQKPPRSWSPKLSGRWVRFWRRFRHREQFNKQRLVGVEVRGLERVQQAMRDGCGVLITPNHSSHADCFALYEAADRLGCPIYAMVAWQVFERSSRLRQLILQQHGCFSIDREGTDLSAVRQAREILQTGRHPLVIFPEGEVYHLNDRPTPFREGPAAIALMAAKKTTRPIVCFPCSMRYRYVDDPTAELTELMDRLENTLLWRPQSDLTLEQRIYRLAEGVLALKEVELLGKTSSGRLPDRIADLIEYVLRSTEQKHELARNGTTVPERIKAARQAVIKKLEETDQRDNRRQEFEDDLDDLFLAVQAFSYPGDYVSEHPSVERVAETLDKFEEDILGVKTATIRGSRHATLSFGEPITLTDSDKPRWTARSLTKELEQQVQSLLCA